MKLHPVVLIIAGSFAAAAALGVLFVMTGSGHSLALDLVPPDSTLIIESGEFNTLEKAIAALGTGGIQQRPLIPHPLADRLLSLRALLPGGSLIIATVPSSSSLEPDVLVIFRAKSAGMTERAAKGIQEWIGGKDRPWIHAEYRGHPYEYSGPSIVSEIVGMGRRRGDLILATSVDLLWRVFDIADQREPSIRASPLLRALKRESGGNRALRVIVPALPSSAQTGSHADSPAATMTEAILGIRTLSGVVVSVQSTEAGFSESAEVVYRESRSGLAATLAALPPSTIDIGEAGQFLPADLPLHVLLSIPSLETVWGHIPRLAASAGLAQEESLRLRMSGLDQVLGVDIARESLGAIGSEILLGIDEVSPLPRGGVERRQTMFSAVAAMEISRPAAVHRMLARAQGMVRLLGGVPRETGVDPALVSWQLPGMEPLEPSWIVDDRFLAVATSARLIISRRSAGMGSLSTRTDIATRMKDLPRRSHLVGLLRLGSFQDSAFGPFLALTRSGSRGDVAIAATFHRHRLSIETRGPFPFILRTLGHLRTDAAVIPPHSRETESAEKATIGESIAPD